MLVVWPPLLPTYDLVMTITDGREAGLYKIVQTLNSGFALV
jgi:hypothetical protein